MSQTTITNDAREKAGQPVISPLKEEDLPEAARIIRHAFGTFVGAPNPETFWTDRDYAFGRWPTRHVASFGATLDGKLVGSNFAVNWGSVGFFGPLSVRPGLQGRGIAQALLARTMAQFDTWGTRHVGLFTFPQSTLHVALYGKFGFHPRFLTAVMSAPAVAKKATRWTRFGALTAAEQDSALRACRELTETIYPGLDLTEEIRATHTQSLGDTVLVDDDNGLAAFAVCQYGPRAEAGAGMCFVKFGAVRAGPSAERDFLRLLDACEALAIEVGMPKVLAGVNTARQEAYQLMLERGFRAELQGVAMHRGNDPGYNRAGVYLLDDWR